MEQTTGGRPALLHTVDRPGLDSSPTGYCALPRRETEGSYTCSAGQCPLRSQRHPMGGSMKFMTKRPTDDAVCSQS